jgi:hypothetical protein
MADNTAKVPGKVEKMAPSTLQPWQPFESFRREVDRLFDDFSGGVWRSPFGRSFFEAVRIVSNDAAADRAYGCGPSAT